MLKVSLEIKAENGFSTTDIVDIPSVSDRVAVLFYLYTKYITG
ncbi:MAG: hypothetical protein PHH06_01325 [Candidatus Gracilibacteria bacterium]|nr:hypothetical protein [Candidatus Gracilibacteria bacterium]